MSGGSLIFCKFGFTLLAWLGVKARRRPCINACNGPPGVSAFAVCQSSSLEVSDVGTHFFGWATGLVSKFRAGILIRGEVSGHDTPVTFYNAHACATGR